MLTRWGTVPSTLLDTNAPWLQQLTELRAARLVTAIFIHADWLHVTGNLLFLIVFGVPAERALGSARFLALFVIGGALANLVGALHAGRHQRADHRLQRRGLGDRRRVPRAIPARAPRPGAAARRCSSNSCASRRRC